MKRWIKLLLKTISASVLALILTSAFAAVSPTAFAAGWIQQQETGRWWYDLGGGHYYAAESEAPRWEWLDGNHDGIAECYAFDSAGWMYMDTETPDGYRVNQDGAWVADGTVQTKAVPAGYGGTFAQEAVQPSETDAGDKKILVAYFSHTGTTETAARRIQEVTGGDLFEIRTVNEYPSSYQAAVDVARRELDSNARPALSTQVANMADYDVVLIGYPIWWHTTPMAVNTFLEAYDLSGKLILPFCTSGGSSVSESLPAVTESSGNGTVGTGLTANRVTEEQIREWLTENGI